ncbi:Membrane attack complex component-perforin (MACPF) domain [Babesia duncani]|uniref:Membrane attack complex component-perforin (MACPF) domain n=1 Tax=Babesia duncani TaxID=323732 RepID=A0AAD9PJ14_9APIC|nr:Membrane attack complex component-perforin (MACPF) domain [Babesia duncani]
MTNVLFIFLEIEYLGCGYDAIRKTNDIYEYGLDVAYKNQVLAFGVSLDKIHTNNTLEYITPNGVYMTIFPSCVYQKEVKQSTEQEEALSSLGVTASYDRMGLSGNAQEIHKNNTASDKSRLINIQYCSMYTATTKITRDSIFVWGFRRAFYKLVNRTRAAKKKNYCNAHILHYKRCSKILKYWFQFFGDFGTHLVTRIIIGGRRSFIEDKAKGSKADQAKLTRDASMEIGQVNAAATDTKTAAAKKTSAGFKRSMTILGGEVTKGFGVGNFSKEWVDSLHKDAIPVKVGITPYSEIFEPLGLQREYKRALELYKAYTNALYNKSKTRREAKE